MYVRGTFYLGVVALRNRHVASHMWQVKVHAHVGATSSLHPCVAPLECFVPKSNDGCGALCASWKLGQNLVYVRITFHLDVVALRNEHVAVHMR